MEELYVSFDRNHMLFLIPVGSVLRIVDSGEKDEDIPVVDFRETRHGEHSMKILVRNSQTQLGILVDHMEQVRHLEDGKMHDLPLRLRSPETDYIQALIVFEQERKIGILLNLDTLGTYAHIESQEP